jgi:hypothetical protein
VYLFVVMSDDQVWDSISGGLELTHIEHQSYYYLE